MNDNEHPENSESNALSQQPAPRPAPPTDSDSAPSGGSDEGNQEPSKPVSRIIKFSEPKGDHVVVRHVPPPPQERDSSDEGGELSSDS